MFRLLASTLAVSTLARADYLEIRRHAWLKRNPAGSGEQLEQLAPGVEVALTKSEQENGYYKVRTRAGTRGYVYRTLVRRHPGALPAAAPVQPSTPSADGPAASVPSGASGVGFRLATFNIQNFGKTKLGRPEVVRQLVDIVRDYALVAVQELSDKTNHVPTAFLAKVNEGGGSYDALVSPRGGEQPDDQGGAQEQYAYYFDTRVVQALSTGELFDDSAHDFFQREPYVARFKVRSGTFTFAIATIHTTPGDIEEIRHLDDVVTWARTKFPDEDDFIVVGDYNAGCNYASPEQLDELPFREPDAYTWLVPDDADTNLAASACAYDRIVVTNGTEAGFVGWGVDRAFTDKKVSDHWPVWAEFRTNEQ